MTAGSISARPLFWGFSFVSPPPPAISPAFLDAAVAAFLSFFPFSAFVVALYISAAKKRGAPSEDVYMYYTAAFCIAEASGERQSVYIYVSLVIRGVACVFFCFVFSVFHSCCWHRALQLVFFYYVV